MLKWYELEQRFILHEGLRLQPYRCSRGKLTIGIGRCVETNPLTAEEVKVVGDWKHGITRGAAVYLLRNDLKRVYQALKKRIDFFGDLDDERQYALIDMGFNLGVEGLLRFRKMLKHLKNKHYQEAAEECLNSQYAKCVGKRAERIANILKTGEFKK